MISEVSEISDEEKKKVFQLISTPGIEIEDIAKQLDIKFDTIMELLTEEYFKHNLDYGRRMCCRF